MIVAKKGKGIINIKRVTPEREGLIREVLYAHTYNIPHIRIAEMLRLPKSTVVRWLNRYYVDSSKQGIPALRVKIPTMTKPDCPHNCYICGKPIPAKGGDSSFCSRKCKAFYNSERKFDRSPEYYFNPSSRWDDITPNKGPGMIKADLHDESRLPNIGSFLTKGVF